VKTFARMAAVERAGKASGEHQDRLAAAEQLDVVRCSFLVPDFIHLLGMLEKLGELKLQVHKCEVLRVLNGFNAKGPVGAGGYREVVVQLLFDGGEICTSADGTCFMKAKVIAEAKLIVQPYLEAKKRTHLLHKIVRGDFDHLAT